MTISEVEVVPLATDVETSDDELTVSLADGRRISVPLVWFPRLLNAAADERAEFRLIGQGEGIHWPRIAYARQLFVLPLTIFSTGSCMRPSHRRRVSCGTISS